MSRRSVSRLISEALASAIAEGRGVKVTHVNPAAFGPTLSARIPPPSSLDVKSEAEFQSQLRSLALGSGWDYYHTHNSRRSDVGFPDTVLIREVDPLLVVAELKVHPNKPTKAQERWLKLFNLCGVPTYLWYPEDWPEIVTLITGRKH